VADEDRRDDEAAAEVVPALDGKLAVVILAEKARGEGGVGVLLLARRLGLGRATTTRAKLRQARRRKRGGVSMA
jgi:hypothetical protein